MTTTDITSGRRRAPVSVLLAQAWAATCTIPMTLMAVVMAMPGVMARYRQRRRDDELGAISVEQFAWIGIALFLIVAAAAALKIYWGDVSTFVTSSWNSITGQGGS
ncbi:MAG TPA: hypothetical protein VN786_08155 [Acidimicrobiales bacterium]|nr:hypothetical protein [Acidimicrobiales bacterium]